VGFQAHAEALPAWGTDIILIRRGKFIGLEATRPGQKQSPDQREFEARTTTAGGEYHVVHSIDDVQRLGF
jgi:hypothetical protein